MHGRSAMFLLAISGVVAACAAADSSAMVRAKAASDFVCEESTVTVSRSANGAYSAMGCGKHAFYDSFCEGTSCSIRARGTP
jgi:hypothetical protein